jgi:ElaA protein
MTGVALSWTFERLENLAPRQVYDLLALRSAVFVVEQNCVFQDSDGVDDRCWHLLGHDQDQRLLAYLRIVDAGVKYAEPSIGRVVTEPAVRGQGYGVVLMEEGIRRAQVVWPGHIIRIGAQHRLEHFYQNFGFESIGDVYIEDDIPHIEMLLAA